MTPKDKAEELVVKYIQYTPVQFEFEYAKKCALICCDEILNSKQAAYSFHIEKGQFFIDYWNDVKQEIEKL